MNKTYLATAFFISLAFTLFLVATSAHASSQATILPNYAGYLELTTIPVTYHVVGEINNTGIASLKLLRVTATFYGQSNLRIGSNSSYAFLEVLLPARKTPFEVVWVGESANQIYSYSLTLEYSEYTGQEKTLALELLANSTYVDQAGFLKLNGTIRNLGMSNATYVRAVATFYQADGKVVGIAHDYTMPSTIMPNSTAPFELELTRKGVTFSNYSMTAESEEYTVVQEFLSPILTLLTIVTLTTIFARTRFKYNSNAQGTEKISKYNLAPALSVN